jgi:phage gp36-like protein
MPYSTETDFLKRISKEVYDELIAPVTGDGLTSVDIRDEAIATADETIDSYISSAVDTVPLDEPTMMITQCSVDISIFNLHSRTQYDRIPDWVKDRYDACIAWLKDVASGKANLGLSVAEEEERVDKTVYGAAERINYRNSI